MTSAAASTPLPLFPLQTVLFPGGLLNLKIFEARYLDLMGRCLREGSGFGVIALRQGSEVRRSASRAAESIELERCGVIAELIDADSPRPGILQVRCRGAQRFAVASTEQQKDGLWIGQVQTLAEDEAVKPTDALSGSVRGLANAIETLRSQGTHPFLEPFRYDDAGWVANRWCEILPISLAAKQRLMEFDDPLVRLQLVDEFLRNRGVVVN